ncbi:hypothetical protein lbkm_1794 [Lachnospiraceae bacterium KM106-2]|nr:hypothetical protein lbkm_1794 [Lachnospiraceae bacterium KM106-2]
MDKTNASEVLMKVTMDLAYSESVRMKEPDVNYSIVKSIHQQIN